MGRGKKTNRMYILHSEWVNDFQGKSAKDMMKKGGKPLPFDYCALSLQPFTNPVCSPSGSVYDLNQIKAFLSKYKVDPTSGEELKEEELIPLHFHKNSEGKYICPSTQRVFSDNSHIVAIKPSGNVYSFEAVDELNIKRRNWKDILEDVEFTRGDIITLNDPKIQRKNWGEYYHITHKLTKFITANAPTGTTKHSSSSSSSSAPTTAALSITQLTHPSSLLHSSSSSSSDDHQKGAGKVNKNKVKEGEGEEMRGYDGGFTCAGFTAKPAVPITPAKAKGKVVKKKGYLSIITSLGTLNFELHCDLTPKTTENFIGLCKSGYYDNVIFHRLIKNFMIQGGDPTGDGTGGESIWGEPFFDEFKPQLSHSDRGILSMANSGPNSNSSQFFILFRAAKHLDNKHTVFGKMVGGFDVLNAMEQIPTSPSDLPLAEIKIIRTEVFADPFLEAEIQQQNITLKNPEDDRIGKWYSNPNPSPLLPSKKGVGKYIQSSSNNNNNNNGKLTGKRTSIEFGAVQSDSKKKKPSSSASNFGNF